MSDISELIVLSNIDSQETARNSLDLFLDIAGGGKGKELNKQKAKQFLTMIQKHLEDKGAAAKSKFYTLYMLKFIVQRPQSKIISILTSHSLLKYFTQVCKETDPNKPMSQKGKNLFPDKQLGNDYIRLILESLKVLAQKAKSSNSEPTKFRKSYDELIDMKIVLPTQLKFYDDPSSRENAKKTSITQAGVTPRGQDTYKSRDVPKGNFKYKQQVEFSVNKINTFVEAANGEDVNSEQLRMQCQSYHKMFAKQTEKYQKIIATLDYTGDEGAHVILALFDFYTEEAKFYKENISDKKDYFSYAYNISFAAQKVNQALGGKESINGQAKPEPRGDEKPSQQANQQASIGQSTRKNNLIQPQQQNKELVTKLMSQLNEKSKSPNVGFKSIKQSLSKQKSFGRSKRSTSGLKRSNATKFGKSMSKSKISEIFTSPPNLYPRQRQYEGELVEPNTDLQKVMKEISKKQGIRRFITCNFRQKNPLFQNTHLQIGIKSEAIYEEVNEFKVLIGIEMYIGNKTEDLVKNLSINYKGGQDVLLYGNPRSVQTVLLGGYQHKHQLLVVPLNYQFPLIKMYLKYSMNDQTIYETITLPNSILKLASYGSITKKQFGQFWKSSLIIYKTQQFKWTRSITPDTLNKYIKPLQQLTSYNDFLLKGAQSDYELGCQVILKQRYEGLLKINIRPNFDCVIQVALADNNEEAVESFIFYLQTLQTLLTHVDHEEL